MAQALPFKLNHSSLLLAVVSTAFAGEAAAVAGRVDFSSGAATVSDAQGRQRALTKGAELDKGDTVRTGDNGRAQIRFTDGAYVSLQPNTEFSIKDYNFQGKTDGSERGLFALARGAMRTVTGLIGRVNRNRYQVSTPTATIGIRGTGGLISIGLDGSTLVNGTSGIWTLTNPSGTIDVPAGVSGKAPTAPSQPPQQTTEKPSTGPTQPTTTQPPYTQADQRGPNGTSETVCTNSSTVNCKTTTTTVAPPPPNPNPPLVSGPGYHVSYAYGSTVGTTTIGINNSGSLANAVFNSTGQLTQFTATNSATFTGVHQEFGTVGGVAAWGRWIGAASGTDGSAFSITPGSNEGYHYVVGIPATAMPTTGSGTFTLVGATKPTGSNTSFGAGPGTFTGTVNVNFAGGPSAITLAATVAFTGFSYSLSGTAGFTGGSPQWTGSSVTTPTNTPGAPAGYNCTGGCTVTIDGAFFGAGAAFAGYAYQIRDNNSPANRVSGAAVFKQ